MTKLHVNCECGNSIGVSPASCGESTTCMMCGNVVPVPALSLFQKSPDFIDRNQKIDRINKRIKKLRMGRNGMMFGCLLIVGQRILKNAGVFQEGMLPVSTDVIIVASCLAYLIYATIRIRHETKTLSSLHRRRL